MSGSIVTCDKFSHFFPSKVYQNSETLRSYSDKRGIENKQKSPFLLISGNIDSFCLDIQTYFDEAAIIFL